MSSASSKTTRRAHTRSFRVGRVGAYRCGRIWYLCYREHGRGRQPRVGPDQTQARQTASEINAQLEFGVPSALGFEPISIADLQQRWLDHHEHVRRSSVVPSSGIARQPITCCGSSPACGRCAASPTSVPAMPRSSFGTCALSRWPAEIVVPFRSLGTPSFACAPMIKFEPYLIGSLEASTTHW